MCSAKRHVRFTPESGHVRCTSRCPLCANSGHSSGLCEQAHSARISPAVRFGVLSSQSVRIGAVLIACWDDAPLRVFVNKRAGTALPASEANLPHPTKGSFVIFISYSRDDLAFADQLDAALNTWRLRGSLDRPSTASLVARTGNDAFVVCWGRLPAKNDSRPAEESRRAATDRSRKRKTTSR